MVWKTAVCRHRGKAACVVWKTAVCQLRGKAVCVVWKTAVCRHRGKAACVVWKTAVCQLRGKAACVVWKTAVCQLRGKAACVVWKTAVCQLRGKAACVVWKTAVCQLRGKAACVVWKTAVCRQRRPCLRRQVSGLPCCQSVLSAGGQLHTHGACLAATLSCVEVSHTHMGPALLPLCPVWRSATHTWGLPCCHSVLCGGQPYTHGACLAATPSCVEVRHTHMGSALLPLRPVWRSDIHTWGLPCCHSVLCGGQPHTHGACLAATLSCVEVSNTHMGPALLPLCPVWRSATLTWGLPCCHSVLSAGGQPHTHGACLAATLSCLQEVSHTHMGPALLPLCPVCRRSATHTWGLPCCHSVLCGGQPHTHGACLAATLSCLQEVSHTHMGPALLPLCPVWRSATHTWGLPCCHSVLCGGQPYTHGACLAATPSRVEVSHTHMGTFTATRSGVGIDQSWFCSSRFLLHVKDDIEPKQK